MKKYKSLIIVVAVLGLITALATGAGKNLLGTQPALVDVYEEPMIGRGMMDEERGVLSQIAAPEKGKEALSDMAIGESRRIMPPVPPTGGGDALDVEDRIYEKSSYHSVVVNDVSDYMRQIKEYILSIDGRVLTSNISTTDKYHYAYITAKIPVEKFDEATGRVTEKVKKVVSENLNAQDRTGQMVSTTSQVEKLEEQILEKEIQLEEATTEAAKKRIELDITRLKRQLETAQKKVETVEAKVEYASIQVTASNSEKYYNPRMVSEPDLWEEVQAAWESVSRILVTVARLGIWVVVYGVVWLPAVLLVKWLKGKKKS